MVRRENSSRAWQSLPECVAVALGRLDAPEVQQLRLVCKDWRRGVSMAFTGKLSPKELALAAAVSKSFPNATSLSCLSEEGPLQRKDFRRIRYFKQLSSLELEKRGIPYSCTFLELTRLPSLTRLTLSNCESLQDQHLSALAAALPHLMELDFSFCGQITSKGVACLSHLRDLETLNLSWCYNVDDEGLEQLCHCTRLHTLATSGLKLTGSFFSTLTPLRSLTARACEGLFEPLDHRLAGLTNLTLLNAGMNAVAIDASSTTMQTLPLKQLKMFECRFKGGRGTMAALATVTTLETLNMHGSEFEVRTASQLMALTRLTDLDMSGCGRYVTQDDLMGISALNGLRSLNLAYCDFALTTGVCKRIAMLTKLEELDISEIKDADAALQHLTALIKLSRLTMANAGLLSTSSIARLTTLTVLVIRYAVDWAYKAVGSAREIDHNLLELATLMRLKELDISKDPAFANADCSKLAKLTSLETLHVSYNPISLSGFKALLRLPRLRTLFCDKLHNLADCQYAFFKNAFQAKIQMFAGSTEYRIRCRPVNGRGPATRGTQ